MDVAEMIKAELAANRKRNQQRLQAGEGEWDYLRSLLESPAGDTAAPWLDVGKLSPDALHALCAQMLEFMFNSPTFDPLTPPNSKRDDIAKKLGVAARIRGLTSKADEIQRYARDGDEPGKAIAAIESLEEQFEAEISRSTQAATPIAQEDPITKSKCKPWAPLSTPMASNTQAPTLPPGATSTDPTSVGDPGMPCSVAGKTKKPLTDGQRAVVTALIKAGDNGMTKDSLEAVRRGARQILRKLKSDQDWDKIILMPGQTNGRYRIRT